MARVCLRGYPKFLPAMVMLALLCGTNAALAADVRTLQVREEAGRYAVVFDVVVDAPIDRSLALLMTPAQWPRLSDIIVDTRVLGLAGGGSQTVEITFRACVWFFCTTIRKTETMTQLREGEVVTLADPERSDFSYAREHWLIGDEGGRTRIRYEAELVPSFTVPPLIGPLIIKAKIRALLWSTASRVETLARPGGA